VPDPTVVHVSADDPEPLERTPDEWVRDAARHRAAGVRRVYLDSVPDGGPWDDATGFDPSADPWTFTAWPGVVFDLPLDE
jgi:hypothetical protein